MKWDIDLKTDSVKQLNHDFRPKSSVAANLRSGPILAVLIHSLQNFALPAGMLFLGAPNVNFRKISRIFGTYVVKFLACLPLLGFSNV